MSAKKASKVEGGKLKLVPVHELIAVQMDRLGLDNPEVARRLGYSSPNVVSMFKAGSMKVPFNKIAPLAELLKVDVVYFGMCADLQGNLGLLPLLESISKRTVVTLNEEKLLVKMRNIADGLDVDLDERPQQLEVILEAFSQAVEKERLEHTLDVGRLKERKRSALLNADRRAAKQAEESENKAA